jgi:hypothetical protein
LFIENLTILGLSKLMPEFSVPDIEEGSGIFLKVSEYYI